MYVTYIKCPPDNAKQATLIQWWNEWTSLCSPSKRVIIPGTRVDKEEDDDDGVGDGDNNFFGEENGAVVEI